MGDIGTHESSLGSWCDIYHEIWVPIAHRDIGWEYRILMHGYTRPLTARGDELDGERSDSTIFPVGESDRIEFEHIVLVIFFLSPEFTF